MICEDIWYDEPVDAVKGAGAEILLTINASPYDINKEHIRTDLLVDHCKHSYANCVSQSSWRARRIGV